MHRAIRILVRASRGSFLIISVWIALRRNRHVDCGGPRNVPQGLVRSHVYIALDVPSTHPSAYRTMDRKLL